MNKLVACALLGFGLTQALVGCSDDDDASPGTSGTGGSSAGKGNAGSSNGGKNSGGTSSGGTSSGGTSSGGKAGSATGGTAGTGTAGSAGNGGSAARSGGSAIGGAAGAGGEGGVAGDTGMAGDTNGGGMGGSGGEPPVELQPATELWLSHFCEARSTETLQCESSKSWGECFNTYDGFMYATGDGICPGEEGDGDPLVKTIALYDAMDALATACPDPDVSQWQCTLGAPQAKDQACRDADEARRTAAANCGI